MIFRLLSALLTVAFIGLTACTSTSSGGLDVGSELRIADERGEVALKATDTSNESPLIYSCLLNSGRSDELVPDLATTVPSLANGLISKDGLTIDYPLQKNAHWQDSVPFTADDVIFTWKAIMDKRNVYPLQYPYSLVRNMTALGPHMLRVHMKRAYAPILHKLFAKLYCFPILPKHLLSRYTSFNNIPFDEHPIGTGPYELQSWNHGDHYELKANPTYFAGSPLIKHIVVKFTSDKNTVVSELKTGELNAAFAASPAEAMGVRGNPKLVTSVSPSSYVGALVFNASDPLTRDVRLRRAIRLAIDRSHMAKTVSYGYFDPRTVSQAAFGWAYDPTTQQPTFNLQAANLQLDNIGWKRGSDGLRYRNGKRLELELASINKGVDPAVDVQIQSQLAQAGIQVTIKTYTDSIFFAPASQHGIYEGALYQMMYLPLYFQGMDGDLSAELDCGLATPKGDNYSRFCDPRMDVANHAAYSTFDPALRLKQYAIVQKLFYSDAPWVLLWTIPKIDIYTKRLRNFVGSNAQTSFFNVAHWSLAK